MEKKREIKFRFWDGWKMQITDFHVTCFGIVWKDSDDRDGSYENRILMQYTGLKDKKGKEIFEDDIVKSFKKEYEDDPSFNTVEFKKGCWRLVCKGKNDIPLFNYDSKELEVIGNIYEHPSQLQKG